MMKPFKRTSLIEERLRDNPVLSSEFLSWLNVASIQEHNPNDHCSLKLYLMAQRVLNRENIFMVDFDNAAAVTVFIGVPGDDGRQVVWQPQDETQDTCFFKDGPFPASFSLFSLFL